MRSTRLVADYYNGGFSAGIVQPRSQRRQGGVISKAGISTSIKASSKKPHYVPQRQGQGPGWGRYYKLGLTALKLGSGPRR